MLQAIRNIIYPLKAGTFLHHSVRLFVKGLLGLYFLLFVADTVNVDVIYASLFGRVIFVDNPDIEDSLFDTGSENYSAAQVNALSRDMHTTPRELSGAKKDIGIHKVYEDIDSLCIQDAQTSLRIEKTLTYLTESECKNTFFLPIDRVIRFRQLLI